MDKILKTLKNNRDFSVEDWNALIHLKLRSFFNNDLSFGRNKELLRTEILNYVLLGDDSAYLELLKWTFDQFNEPCKLQKNSCIDELSKHIAEVSNTDSTWLSYSITEPNINSLSKRDKTIYLFDTINNVLEKCFKPRFELLYKFSFFNESGNFNNKSKGFGSLIKHFPKSYRNNAILYLGDPHFSISTNQWRNIAAHKTYDIKKDEINITYGTKNKKSATLTHEDLLKIVNWVKKSYGTLRLAEVLIYLNYTQEIVSNMHYPRGNEIRLESWLFHITHNMQIVGFQFVSTEEKDNTFIINFRSKKDRTLKESIIHASQCLSQLSGALESDYFLKGSYKFTQVNIVNEKSRVLASAIVEIEKAILHSEGKISLEEYSSNVNFKFK